MSSSEMAPCNPLNSAFRLRRPSKQHNFRVHRLISRRRRLRAAAKGLEKISSSGAKVEMEMKNLKLFMENQSIIEENNKLRRKALSLVQENQALFSQLQLQQNHQLSQQHIMHAPPAPAPAPASASASACLSN